MVCCLKYWCFGLEWDSKPSHKLDLQGNPSPYSALDVLIQTVPVKIFVPVVESSHTHSPLITGFSVSQTGIGWSSRVPGCQGYTPVTTHSLSPSLLLRWFSGRSGELRCISTETGVSGSPGTQPDSYGRSCLLSIANIRNVCPQKPTLQISADIHLFRFRVAVIDPFKGGWHKYLWSDDDTDVHVRMAAGGPLNTIYISFAESISLLDHGGRCITAWRGTVLPQIMLFLFVCTCRLPDSLCYRDKCH